MSALPIEDDVDVYVPQWEWDHEGYYAECAPGPATYPSIRKGRPVFLSGVNCPGLAALEDRGYDVGLLLQPGNGTAARAADYRMWAADNGCFAEATGGKWTEDGWFSWLSGIAVNERLRWGSWGFEFESRRMEPGPDEPEPMGCLFATAPDVVGDQKATWRRSLPWFQRVRSLGLPVALVAQNGAESFAPMWDEPDRWDCLFIGGVCPHCLEAAKRGEKKCGRPDHNDWKLSADARDCVKEAQLLGKWVHMGRVNSNMRLRLAAAWDCDSADGTYLKFGSNRNVPKLASWMEDLIATPVSPCPTFMEEFEARWATEPNRTLTSIKGAP